MYVKTLTHHNSARIILTRGALETLDKSEVNALVAHEIGHIVNRDIVLMTAAQIIPLIGFYSYRYFWNKTHHKNKLFAFLNIIPANIFYFLYIVTQWPILWFSRVREYYADVFAGENIPNPSNLAQALIKVAYGIAARSPSAQKRYINLEAAGAMGIIDKSKAMGIAITSFPDRQFNQEINIDLLSKSMRWDLWSPWAKLYELSSTHPMVSKRIKNLMMLGKLYNKETFMKFNDIKPESYWNNFIIELIIIYMPRMIFMFLIGLGAYFHHQTVIITNSQEIFFALCVSLLGLSMLIKHKFHYPTAFFPAMSVSSLLKKVNISRVCPSPATLQGKIVGKGISGFLVTNDHVFQDDSGILVLDHKRPYRFWESIFSILKKHNFNNKDVIIEGWYHRDDVPYFTVKSVTCEGETYFNFKCLISKFFSFLVLFLGFAWMLQIVLFLFY